MPAFTPIDLIASLAALNRGDLENFRQPYSREGRQQALDERQLRTRDIALRKQIADYFAGLQPNQLPPAQAQRTTEQALAKGQAESSSWGPQATANVAATQAGAGYTTAQTDALRAVQDLLRTGMLSEIGARQAGAEHTREVTRGLQEGRPFIAPEARERLLSSQAGRGQTEANTMQIKTNTTGQGYQNEAYRKVQEAADQPAIQQMFQNFLHVARDTQVPPGLFAAAEPAVRAERAAGLQTTENQLRALVGILGQYFPATPQGQAIAPTVAQRIGELIGTDLSTPVVGNTNKQQEMLDVMRQFMQQGGKQADKSAGTARTGIVKHMAGIAGAPTQGLSWLNQNVMQPLQRGGQSMLESFQNAPTAGSNAPAVPDDGQLQQALELIKRLMMLSPGSVQPNQTLDPRVPTDVPAEPPPMPGQPDPSLQNGQLPMWFYRLLGEK